MPGYALVVAVEVAAARADDPEDVLARAAEVLPQLRGALAGHRAVEVRGLLGGGDPDHVYELD